jgi:hypothetical protein
VEYELWKMRFRGKEEKEESEKEVVFGRGAVL